MDLSEMIRNVKQIWELNPGAVVLLTLGFLVFIFLVVDAWRHKRRHRRPQ
jgi:hypothetical protein